MASRTESARQESTDEVPLTLEGLSWHCPLLVALSRLASNRVPWRPWTLKTHIESQSWAIRRAAVLAYSDTSVEVLVPERSMSTQVATFSARKCWSVTFVVGATARNAKQVPTRWKSGRRVHFRRGATGHGSASAPMRYNARLLRRRCVIDVLPWRGLCPFAGGWRGRRTTPGPAPAPAWELRQLAEQQRGLPDALDDAGVAGTCANGVREPVLAPVAIGQIIRPGVAPGRSLFVTSASEMSMPSRHPSTRGRRWPRCSSSGRAWASSSTRHPRGP